MSGISIRSFFFNNRQLLLLDHRRAKRHSWCFLIFDRICLIKIPLRFCSVWRSYKARSLCWKFAVIISLNEPYVLAYNLIDRSSCIGNSSLSWLIRLYTAVLFDCSTIPLLFWLIFNNLTLDSFYWHIIKRVNELLLVLTLIRVLRSVYFSALSGGISIMTTISTCSRFTLRGLCLEILVIQFRSLSDIFFGVCEWVCCVWSLLELHSLMHNYLLLFALLLLNKIGIFVVGLRCGVLVYWILLPNWTTCFQSSTTLFVEMKFRSLFERVFILYYYSWISLMIAINA